MMRVFKSWFLINFLILIILKEIIFAFIVPIFHTPDEQAHLAQVANFAEKGNSPKAQNLNREIYITEDLLGTLRDNNGNNKFTYHPEYKIDYTTGLNGKYEQEIKDIPLKYRTEYVKNEAANYPPLYYWIAAIPYRLFYYADLITRIYSIRVISILLNIGTIYISWLIAKKIFPKNEMLQISLPSLVAFHPMLSFLSVGINSDNLMNFLFSLFIYFNILIIDKGISKNLIIMLLLNLFALYLTKPQFIFAIPILFSALLLSMVNKVGKKQLIIKSSVALLIIFVVIAALTNQDFVLLIQKAYPQLFFPGIPKIWANPIAFFNMTLSKTIRETIPWYWGVFDWLGVVLPLNILRVINRLLIILSLGILVKIFQSFKNHNKQDLFFIYLVTVSIVYYLGVVIFDYIFYSKNGYSFGLQGRYFFPTIIPHMALLIYGLNTLIIKPLMRFQYKINKFFILLMVALNCFVIWLIANTYYDLRSLEVFINQVSQYKPNLLKGEFVPVILTLYTLSLVIFIIGLTKKSFIK